MPTPANTSRSAIPPRFFNGDDFLAGLGNVALSRIVFDPWPGTATEADVTFASTYRQKECELVHHTLIETASCDLITLCYTRLTDALRIFTIRNRLGLTSNFCKDALFRMQSGNIRRPPIWFVDRTRCMKRQRPTWDFAPSLVVEIVGIEGRNEPDEMGQKLQDYFLSGCRLAWIIHHDKSEIEVYQTPQRPERLLQMTHGHLLQSPLLLPGFVMPLAEIFHSHV